jgi:hypothetical protein
MPDDEHAQEGKLALIGEIERPRRSRQEIPLH